MRDQLCQPCRLAPPPFVQAIAYGVYEDELRELIHLLKYRRMAAIARGLGERLGRLLGACPGLPERMVVVPVPLHRSRRRGRGFNQSEGIARGVLAGLRFAAPEKTLAFAPFALRRVRATASQSSLSSRGRRRNLRGAFALGDASRVAGQHVLLVDDIYTTGATARGCSKTLLAAGALSVTVATVARAQREGVAQWDATPSLGGTQATTTHSPAAPPRAPDAGAHPRSRWFV